MMFLKKIRVFLWLLVVVAIGFYAFAYFSDENNKSHLFGQSRQMISDFNLVDDKGQPITDEAWRGEPLVVFFGFTHCPDVCPVTLVHISQWLEDIGGAGAHLKPYFVTLDPDRDTPEVLGRYIGNFSKRIIGVTGKEEAIEALAKSMGIYSKKVAQGDDYTVDHTASILLIKPDGTLLGTIAYGEAAETAKKKLLRLAQAAS